MRVGAGLTTGAFHGSPFGSAARTSVLARAAEQYERMMEQLRAGYGPDGGPSREEIERLRRDGVLLFR